MSVESNTAAPPAAHEDVEAAARGLRIAGRAALTASIVWLVEPIAFIATLLNPDNMRMDQTLAEFRAANPFGLFVGVGLIVLGMSVGIAVLASGRARAVQENATYPVMVGQGMGFLAAGALIVAGAIDLTHGGLAGSGLVMIPDVPENARWLANQSITLIHEGFRLSACLGLAAWFVILALTGRRAALIGRGTPTLLWIAAILVFVPGAATGLLTGMNVVLLGLIPLAVAWLRRGRRSAS
jgi:hypothetical protein